MLLLIKGLSTAALWRCDLLSNHLGAEMASGCTSGILPWTAMQLFKHRWLISASLPTSEAFAEGPQGRRRGPLMQHANDLCHVTTRPTKYRNASPLKTNGGRKWVRRRWQRSLRPLSSPPLRFILRDCSSHLLSILPPPLCHKPKDSKTTPAEREES